MYNILPNTYKKAKLLGIKIYPSTNPKYKIDIYDYNNNYIFSIGASGYLDYQYYLKLYGKSYAEERRRLYMIRHNKDINKEGSKGYYSFNLLWN
jgi:hypothetical protein